MSKSLPYSAILYENNGSKNIILMDDALAQSLLVKLYFFDGASLSHIKPFLSQRDLTGRTQIKVFEVDWSSFMRQN